MQAWAGGVAWRVQGPERKKDPLRSHRPHTPDSTSTPCLSLSCRPPGSEDEGSSGTWPEERETLYSLGSARLSPSLASMCVALLT